MSEVIVITSGKGGVGKTTTTANVGTGLAKEGKKVVLIDTDIGLRNLDVVMGLENRIVYNLVDVVEGNCRIKQAMIKDKKYPNLFPFFFPYPNVFKNRIQPIVYPDQPVFLKKSIFTTGIPDIDYQIHCLKFKSLIYHLLPASVFSHISRT